MAELSTLARPYARAAFEYADRNRLLDEWLDQLGMAAVIIAEPRVALTLARPALTAGEQADIFIEVCGDSLSAPVANFMRVLASSRRLPLLPEISAQFAELRAAREKSIDVHVVSAFDLSGDVRDKLAEALGRNLGRDVRLSSETDSGLLGGLLIRAGDTVIDGSVRGRLNKLAEALTN